jgi:uncharacterized protein
MGGVRRVERRGLCRARRREVVEMVGSLRPQVLPYLVITFGWTWALWWTAALYAQRSAPLLVLLGGLGPLVAAAWVVHRRGATYRRRFLRRVWDPRGVAGTWWWAVLGVAAVPALLGATTAKLAGVAAISPDRSATAVGGIVAFALAAGLVEEPGWRGVASDAWQARVRPVWAAVVIGAVWSLWHLPLYLVEGSYQHGLGFGSVRFWLASVALVPLSVLYVWLANGAGRSILIVILAHAGSNITGELVSRSTVGDVVAFLVLTAAAVTVVAVTRGWLRHRPRPDAGSGRVRYGDGGWPPRESRHAGPWGRDGGGSARRQEPLSDVRGADGRHGPILRAMWRPSAGTG